MSNKKFELTTNTKMFLGKKLFQIKALVSFGNVEAGELGGYVEKEENLSQEGNAWVCDDARRSATMPIIQLLRDLGQNTEPLHFLSVKMGKCVLNVDAFTEI